MHILKNVHETGKGQVQITPNPILVPDTCSYVKIKCTIPYEVLMMSIREISRRADDRALGLLKKHFPEEASITIWQFIKSLVAGGIATAVDIGMLWFLKDKLHIYYIIANILSFSAGLLVNYIITGLWVFDGSKIKDRKTEFSLFTLIALAGLGLNTLFMWIFTDFIKIHYLISKGIATILVYGFNFAARKIFIYK